MQESKYHVIDVAQGLNFFIQKLLWAANIHDYDKFTELNWFYNNFQTGFTETDWLQNHYKIHRHHINEPQGTPNDVNLIDVLEYITDRVIAGMARSGHVEDISLPPELLTTAFNNTVETLKNNVQIDA